MPRFLELLDRHDLKATFFVIGRDIADNEEVLAGLARSGHELANHTMNHPKQLVHLDVETIAREIDECGRRIEALLHLGQLQRPVGQIRGLCAPNRLIAQRQGQQHLSKQLRAAGIGRRTRGRQRARR